MKQKRCLTALLCLLSYINMNGQCLFCRTYEDFRDDKWEKLDTIFLQQHSKSRQFWWGGNDFTLSCGDKAIDKMLKKEAFVVMHNDTMYVNCRNLRFEKTRFRNGFTRAMRIGEQSILFVNEMIGKDAMSDQFMSGYLFGTIGAIASSNHYMNQQVCYVISWGADDKGKIPIRIVDDNLIIQMLENRYDLIQKYKSERNQVQRRLATHVLPILEKAGLIKHTSFHQTP